MKKIPTLFERDYHQTHLVYNQVTPGCEWVINGEGLATEKLDGIACLIQDGVLYKRYDAKNGKTPPPNWIAAQEPDAVTGHWPGWMPVGDGPEDQWFREGWRAMVYELPHPAIPEDGTYELLGPKIQGNPYYFQEHELWRHGSTNWSSIPKVAPPRDFEGLKQWFSGNETEGIVWHHPDGRMCKLKRKDFGFPWPIK